MNAMPLVIAALAIFALAYRFYFGFIASKILTLDSSRVMPSGRLYDGQNYYPMSKWVLFGHHFAAIAGAGPLVGPVLACQFGYFPGFVWMVVGAVMAGAVHDMVILTASIRHDGKSLAFIARTEIGKATSGGVTSFAIFLIIIIAIAGLGLVVVNALSESSWGLFTIASTIPIALFMGVWMFQLRKGKVTEATIMGVILLTAAVIFGRFIPGSSLASWFTFDHKTLTLLLAGYGFIASVLPVWLLLSPRDYLSSIMKLGVIAMLAVGIIVVAPSMKMPAFTSFIHGGGPIIPGTLFPYLFITIACGAISGFHAIIGSGTTPKMIANEKDILFVGYGAMLTEGFVAIMALIAACVLVPADYFAINAAPAAFAKLGISPVNLPELATQVGEQVQGRPGGAVSLAVGMAYIFSSVPFMKGMMAYWYHFAIMFEAVFILTAVDAGTRVGRYLLQEMLGRVYKPFADNSWTPGVVICSVLFTGAWGYLVYTGDISTIWPLFGMANQLLASCALIVGTTMLIRLGKAKYAWTTAVPALLVFPTVMWAGYMNVIGNFLPKGLMLLVTMSILLMVLITIVFIAAFRRWSELLKTKDTVTDAYGDKVLAIVTE